MRVQGNLNTESPYDSRVLYFAYGSNLNETDLDRYCLERALPPIGLESVGLGFLPDRRLAFTHRSSSRGGGVLDVIR